MFKDTSTGVIQLELIHLIYLHLIFVILQFEISKLFQTWILQATAGKKSPVQTRKKNQVRQTRYFKLESSADR